MFGVGSRKEFLPVLRLQKLYYSQPSWEDKNDSFTRPRHPAPKVSTEPWGLVHKEVSSFSYALPRTINSTTGLRGKARVGCIANRSSAQLHTVKAAKHFCKSAVSLKNKQFKFIELELNQMLVREVIFAVHPHEKEQDFVSILFLIPMRLYFKTGRMKNS